MSDIVGLLDDSRVDPSDSFRRDAGEVLFVWKKTTLRGYETDTSAGARAVTRGHGATRRRWLYGIATTASLDLFDRRSRRLPQLVSDPGESRSSPEPSREIRQLAERRDDLLEPNADRLLDGFVWVRDSS